MTEIHYGISAFVVVLHANLLFARPGEKSPEAKNYRLLPMHTALQGVIQLLLHLSFGLSIASAATSSIISCVAFLAISLILIKLRSRSSS